MLISEITAKIMDGDYPDIPRPEDERVILCNDNITQYYATIVASLLLNNVPEPKADVIIPKRLRLFDNIIRTINSLRICRLSCLLDELDAIVENSKKDKDLWLSKKSANNICTFITEFWVWDEQTRVNFINGTEMEEDDIDLERADAESSEDNTQERYEDAKETDYE